MQNIEMTVDKNILTLKIDLSKRFGLSNSGKTYIIATTGGNKKVPENEEMKLGLNLFVKNADYQEG